MYERHGFSKDRKTRPEYWAWHNAKRRCEESNRHNFHRYGGRGISMCAEWKKSFAAFIAHIGPRPNGRTLDRIDNNKGYEPGNVRWATRSQQALNRRQGAADKRVLTTAQLKFIKKNYVPFSNEFGTRALARRFNTEHSVIRYALENF